MAVYVKLIDVFNNDHLRAVMLNLRKTKKRKEVIIGNVIARLAEHFDVRMVAPDSRPLHQSAGEGVLAVYTPD
ncbi:hypothetical protein V7S43_006462 [Phytophthora oleae]|uniref:Uncharacterized protein n=1 Tax=Phytophthora oleae TaxID=2107226 RepID=A0ABD3FNB2_9STRA